MSLTADLALAAGGDRGAYARLVEHTRGLVTSVALSVVRDVATSEDVAQDVYLAVWRDLRTLRNPASFLPWLRQLTRNRARDVLRLRRRRPEVSDDTAATVADPTDGQERQILAAEERAALEEAFEELAEDSREVLALFYREGRSVTQVAALLELREATVKKRLQRARDTLRAAILERLGAALARSAPGATFTAAVLGSLGTSAPSTAMAATATGMAAASKLGAAFGASSLGAVLGTLGVLTCVAPLLALARDDEERRGLRRVMLGQIAVSVVASVVMPLAALLAGAPGLVAGFVALVAGVASGTFVALPRVVAEGDGRAGGPSRPLRHALRRVQWTTGGGALVAAATVVWLVVRIATG